MVKKIKNPISTVVTEVDGEKRCRADYGVESDGVKERRSEELVLTEATLSDIHEQTVAAINAKEGTTGEPQETEPPE